MSQGIWLLVMVLRIGQFDVILKPVALYDNFTICMMNKSDLEKQDHIPRSCVKQRKV